MDISQLYRLQIALKSGSGFELLCTMSEQALVDEIRDAKKEGRLARIASPSSGADMAASQFDPKDLSGYMHMPVQRIARV